MSAARHSSKLREDRLKEFNGQLREEAFMDRLLFNPNHIEQTVTELDSFRNNKLAPVAFGMAITALMNHSPTIASVAIVFIFLWGMANVLPVKASHKRFYDTIPFLHRDLVALRRNWIFGLAMGFLVLVACGVITIENLPQISRASRFAG